MAFMSKLLNAVSCKKIYIFATILCTLTILSAQENFNNFSRAGEFLIDTVVKYSLPFYYQNSPHVAFDGNNYLVIWDHNWYDGGDGSNGKVNGIFGTRVTPSGIILDSGSIRISNRGVGPSVAFDGENYLIAWSADSIFCSRLDTAGVLIDDVPIVVSADTNLSEPLIAFDGVNYFIVWTRSGGEYPYFWYSTYGSRVTPEGIVLDPHGILVADGCFSPSIAFGDSLYFVVCSAEAEQFYFYVFGFRISTTGQILDSIPIIISEWYMGMSQLFPDVIYGGSNFFTIWSSEYGIWGKRINKLGQILDSTHIGIMGGDRPAIAYNNNCYFITADRATNGVYGVRVDTSGSIIDTTPLLISNAPSFQWYSDVAAGDTNFLAVWRDERHSLTQKNIYGARVTNSVNVLDTNGIAISTSANWQELSAGAFDYNNESYFHVWRDSRNISSDIYGILSDSLGHALDTSIAISTAIKEQTNPAISSSSDQFLCVWQDCRIDSLGSDIYGARIDSSGHLLDPQGIMISSASYRQSIPAVASCGTSYFTIWQDWRNNDYDIYGVRVSRNGVVLDPNGILISIYQPSYQQTSPAIAFDGSNYQVVYSDNTYGANDIFGVRIDTLGNIIVPFMVISNAYSGQYTPAVAFNGSDDYMVVWEDDRNGSDFRDIYGTIVDTAGNVVYPEGFPISIAAGQQRYPSICFDGTNYLVTWQDNRNGDWDIHGAKVSSTGQVLNTYAIMTDANDQYAPALIKGDTDKSFISWSGWTDSINGRPANTMRIWGKMYPFAEIAEDKGNVVQTIKDELELYPNPFLRKVNIRYTIHDTRCSMLKIYDISGRLVKSFNHLTNNSFNQTTWLGDDNSGNKLPAGIYFIQLTTGNQNLIRKVVLLE